MILFIKVNILYNNNQFTSDPYNPWYYAQFKCDNEENNIPFHFLKTNEEIN